MEKGPPREVRVREGVGGSPVHRLSCCNQRDSEMGSQEIVMDVLLTLPFSSFLLHSSGMGTVVENRVLEEKSQLSAWK